MQTTFCVSIQISAGAPPEPKPYNLKETKRGTPDFKPANSEESSISKLLTELNFKIGEDKKVRWLRASLAAYATHMMGIQDNPHVREYLPSFTSRSEAYNFYWSKAKDLKIVGIDRTLWLFIDALHVSRAARMSAGPTPLTHAATA